VESSARNTDIKDITPSSKRPREMSLDEEFNFGDNSDDDLMMS